jgi:hypothetical protein
LELVVGGVDDAAAGESPDFELQRQQAGQKPHKGGLLAFGGGQSVPGILIGWFDVDQFGDNILNIQAVISPARISYP